MTANWHEQASEQWDEMSENWHSRSKEMWETGSRKAILPFLMNHLPKAPLAILDAGCGDGYSSFLLAKEGYQTIGVDLSKEMIERAKRLQQDELNLSFQIADLTQLPFQSNSFDAVLTINALEWTEHPIDGIAEIHRVLKGGGLLCLGILGPTAAPRKHSFMRLYKKQVICNTMMPWECRQLLLDYDFELLDEFGVYKEGVTENHLKGLSTELMQALSFLWVFLMKKKDCKKEVF